MAGFNKVDSKTKDERINQVGLMLRRKPMPFILQYIAQNWGLKNRQAYNYARLARAEWAKYSEKLKTNARAYSLAKLRDLNDMAHSKKVVVGTIDNKQVIQVPDLGLILDICKEENKLLGIYPSENHNVKVEGELKVTTDATQKLTDRINNIIDHRRKKETT